MKLSKMLFGAAVATLVAVPTVQAQSVSSTAGTNTVYSSIDEAILGNMMAGLGISATFDNNVTVSGTWGDLGGGTWGVDLYNNQTHYLRVTLNGTTNTFENLWKAELFQNTDILTLTFNGGTAYGNVLFDRPTSSQCVNNCAIGSRGQTTGSSTGDDFDIVNVTNDGYTSWYENGTAEYINTVSVLGEPIKYDLFSKVAVTFDFYQSYWNNADGPDNGNSPFYFYMDTDKGVSSSVPEPSTYALMSAGLLGIFAAARRRRQA